MLEFYVSMTSIRPTIWILLHASPAPNHLTYQKYGTQTTLKSSPRGVQFYLKMNIYFKKMLMYII